MDIPAVARMLRRCIWPETCLHCRKDLAPTEEEDLLCAPCRDRLTPSRPPYCLRCASPFPRRRLLCRACARAKARPSCEIVRAAFLYRGPAVSVVRAAKFLGRRRAAARAADWMAGSARGFPELARIDAVTRIPLHPRRIRERGFNQARVMAETMALRSGRPLLDLLIRRKATSPQWRLDRAQRRENLQGAFQASPGARGKSILLVDDVCTTGATLEEAARILRESGATRVYGFVFARD